MFQSGVIKISNYKHQITNKFLSQRLISLRLKINEPMTKLQTNNQNIVNYSQPHYKAYAIWRSAFTRIGSARRVCDFEFVICDLFVI